MLALVRLRGEVDTQDAVRDTLDMLNLHEVNHCTLIPETDTYRGMVTKVNDRVAFGEPSVETVAELVRRRGEALSACVAVHPECGTEALGNEGERHGNRGGGAEEEHGSRSRAPCRALRNAWCWALCLREAEEKRGQG